MLFVVFEDDLTIYDKLIGVNNFLTINIKSLSCGVNQIEGKISVIIKTIPKKAVII